MTDEQIHQDLVTHLADLEEAYVLQLIERLLREGQDPLALIRDCEQAMRVVGERYENQEYYLSGLIMAGEIFREVLAMTQPVMQKHLSGNASGRILLGTVQGDIHNIGKGILEITLRCYGFTVEDLGVDVPPQRFLASVQRDPPDVVGLSGLVTVSYESMKATIQLLRERQLPGQPAIPIIIGGGMLNDQVCRYVGADYWTTNPLEAVRICQRLVNRDRPSPT
jgi:methanogenic corrinoid protein MtbC1